MEEQKTFAQKLAPVFAKLELLAAALSVLTVAGTLLTGSGAFKMLLTTSLATLALVYYISGFINHKSTAIPRWIVTVAYSGMGILCIALLFKMQFWIGSKPMLMVGMAALGLGFAGIISKRDEIGANAIFIRVTLFSVIGIVMTLVTDGDLAKMVYKNDPIMVEKIIKVENDPNNEASHKELEEYSKSLRKR